MILGGTASRSHPKEAAIVRTLTGNNAPYTADVSGTNGTTGIGIVEIYALN